MLELSTIKLAKKKEKVYELACECTNVFLGETEASRVLEEMTCCNKCKEPVYLVVESEEIT
jgi:predicted SprT family Zn-dependent metalloprotease